MRFKILDQRHLEWIILPTIEEAENHLEMLSDMHPQNNFKIEVVFSE